MSRAAHAPVPAGIAPEVWAAYRAAPETMVAEILDGELVLLPRPSRRHGHAAMRLATRLRPYHDPDPGEPGGWLFLPEPELWLGLQPDIVIPDLAAWRTERLPPDFLDDAPPRVTLAPDWVCEVLSPSTERRDRGDKLQIYCREGVGHVWLVDPLQRFVDVFRLEHGRWVLAETHEGDGTLRAAPFDQVDLPLAALWSLRPAERR